HERTRGPRPGEILVHGPRTPPRADRRRRVRREAPPSAGRLDLDHGARPATAPPGRQPAREGDPRRGGKAGPRRRTDRRPGRRGTAARLRRGLISRTDRAAPYPVMKVRTSARARLLVAIDRPQSCSARGRAGRAAIRHGQSVESRSGARSGSANSRAALSWQTPRSHSSPSSSRSRAVIAWWYG